MVEDAKWNDALSGGHSLEGSPVEGHAADDAGICKNSAHDEPC